MLGDGWRSSIEDDDCDVTSIRFRRPTGLRPWIDFGTDRQRLQWGGRNTKLFSWDFHSPWRHIMDPMYVVILIVVLTLPWTFKKYDISDFKPSMAIAAAFFLLLGVGLYFYSQT